MFEDLELAEYGGLALIVLVIVYFAYKAFSSLSGNGPASTADAQGNYASGAAGKILDNTLSVGSSSEDYTTAASQTILHPLDTIESILGFSPSGN